MRTRIVAAQPVCTPLDVGANVRAHAAVVRSAGADLLVFPELSLTGYELTAAALDPADPVLEPLIAACADTGAVAFVGAPVEGIAPVEESAPVEERSPAGHGTRRHIAVLRVDGSGARIVHRKQDLGAAEAPHFLPAPVPSSGAVTVTERGLRIGLGICKDTGSPRHLATLADDDLDVYLAGVFHLPAEIPEQQRRGRHISALTGALTVFANAAGPCSTTYPDAGGHSAVFRDGECRAEAGGEPGDLVVVTLDH